MQKVMSCWGRLGGHRLQQQVKFLNIIIIFSPDSVSRHASDVLSNGFTLGVPCDPIRQGTARDFQGRARSDKVAHLFAQHRMRERLEPNAEGVEEAVAIARLPLHARRCGGKGFSGLRELPESAALRVRMLLPLLGEVGTRRRLVLAITAVAAELRCRRLRVWMRER